MNEIELPTLFVASPAMRAIWALSFIDTASPALSSAGEVIFEPEDKRARDLPSARSEDCAEQAGAARPTDLY
ncbi:MAG: hypothetical protein U1F98_04145 [Verrucomicrobiota bacterium]